MLVLKKIKFFEQVNSLPITFLKVYEDIVGITNFLVYIYLLIK